MINKFKEPPNFDLIYEFLDDFEKNDDYMEQISNFFTENMNM